MDGDDKAQPGRINSLLLELMTRAFEEYYHHIRIGGDSPCPNLGMLTYQAELHGQDYPESYAIYRKTEKEIISRYYSSGEMSVSEHEKRLQNVLDLLKRIGTFRLRERNPYPEAQEADDYDIASFNYDISTVDSTIPLVKQLVSFYYSELRKEYEDKPDTSRRKESVVRAKQAYVFYMKYKEYEQSGFDMTRIEEIFGLSDEEQDILTYWIREVLPHGSATSIFAKPGAGKSNSTTFIMQCILILQPGWDVITTIPLIFSPNMKGEVHFPEYRIDRIHFVRNSGELLMEEARIGLQGRIPAVILDEFDSALISTQMQGQAGTNLKDYIFVERHYDVQGPLLVYHSRKDIPVPLRNRILSYDVYIVTLYYNRLTRKYRHVLSNPERDQYATHHGYKGKVRYLPIPRSLLPYYNQGTSPFDLMDVNMTWLNNHLSGTREDSMEQILKLVPERGWDEEAKKKKEEEEKQRVRDEKIRMEKEERERKERERQERAEKRRKEDEERRNGKGRPSRA